MLQVTYQNDVKLQNILYRVFDTNVGLYTFQHRNNVIICAKTAFTSITNVLGKRISIFILSSHFEHQSHVVYKLAVHLLVPFGRAGCW